MKNKSLRTIADMEERRGKVERKNYVTFDSFRQAFASKLRERGEGEGESRLFIEETQFREPKTKERKRVGQKWKQ